MSLAQLQQMLSDGIDDPAFVDQLIRQIQMRKALPTHAPIAGYVRAEDHKKPKHPKTHRERMEEGSAMLANAIAVARKGKVPKTPDKPIWLHETHTKHDAGSFVYEPPRFAARGPCGRCGVREDKHREFGCSHYAGAVACL